MIAAGREEDTGGRELLNVSNDPTRALWRDLNVVFIGRYEREHGGRLSIRQSHGDSGSQARAVIDGLGADVVTRRAMEARGKPAPAKAGPHPPTASAALRPARTVTP